MKQGGYTENIHREFMKQGGCTENKESSGNREGVQKT